MILTACDCGFDLWVVGIVSFLSGAVISMIGYFLICLDNRRGK